MIDCAVLLRLLLINNEEIMDHLNSLGYQMSINNVLFKWLLSLFIQNTSEKMWACIWDLLLLEGHIVLFKAAIGLLKIKSKEITSTFSLEGLMKMFDEKFEHVNSVNRLKYYLIIKRFDFDMDLIDNNRYLISPGVSKTISKIPNLYNKKKKQNQEKCNLAWPYCINNINEPFIIKDYSIYKEFEEPFIIPNYFFKKRKGHIRYEKNKNLEPSHKHLKKSSSFLQNSHKMNIDIINEDDCMEIYNHLMVERQKHTCNEKRNITTPTDTMEKKRSKSETRLYYKFKKIFLFEEDEQIQQKHSHNKNKINQPINNDEDEKVNTLIEFYKYEYSMNI